MLIVLAIVGLSLFEIITSIDNAVINAEVLSGEVLDTTFSIDSVSASQKGMSFPP